MNLLDAVLNLFRVKRPPSPPILLTPESSAWDVENPVLFTWKAGDNLRWPATYELEIYAGVGYMPPPFFRADMGAALSKELSGFQAGQVYGWRMRAHNKYGHSEWIGQPFTMASPPPPPAPVIPIRLQIPQVPDNKTESDGAAFWEATARLWHALGGTGVLMHTRFYGFPWGHAWLDLAAYHHAFAVCDQLWGGAKGVQIETGKPTKTAWPCEPDTVFILHAIGHNLLPRLLGQTSGYLEVGQVKFLTLILDLSEQDRLYRLKINTDGKVFFRWYPKLWGRAKYVQDYEVMGQREFDCPSLWQTEFTIRLENKDIQRVYYNLLEFAEVTPDASQIAASEDFGYRWKGNAIAYTKPFLHPHFEDPAVVDTLALQMANVHGEYSWHLSYEEQFANADEASCLERKGRANVSDLLGGFLEALAAKQYETTGRPLAFYTTRPNADGYRCCDMTGGGFSTLYTRLTPNSKIKYKVYEMVGFPDALSVFAERGLPFEILIHVSNAKKFEEIAFFKDRLAALTPEQRLCFKGWSIYAGLREHCTPEMLNPMMQAMRA